MKKNEHFSPEDENPPNTHLPLQAFARLMPTVRALGVAVHTQPCGTKSTNRIRSRCLTSQITAEVTETNRLRRKAREDTLTLGPV